MHQEQRPATHWEQTSTMYMYIRCSACVISLALLIILQLFETEKTDVWSINLYKKKLKNEKRRSIMQCLQAMRQKVGKHTHKHNNNIKNKKTHNNYWQTTDKTVLLVKCNYFNKCATNDNLLRTQTYKCRLLKGNTFYNRELCPVNILPSSSVGRLKIYCPWDGLDITAMVGWA